MPGKYASAPRDSTDWATINVRLPKALYEKTKLLAERDTRSVSNYVVKLLRDQISAWELEQDEDDGQ